MVKLRSSDCMNPDVRLYAALDHIRPGASYSVVTSTEPVEET